jgi:hypothetical protein
LKLDRALAKLGEKKVEVVAAPQNPYTKGTVATSTAYTVGDSYSVRQFDVLTKAESGQPFTHRITHITDNEVIYNNGTKVTDLLGNNLKLSGNLWTPNQTVPTEFIVGKRWNTRFHVIDAKGRDSIVELDLKVADREKITVGAGTFNAFRVEARGWMTGPGVNLSWNWKTWFAPDQLRYPVAWEWLNRLAAGRIVNTNRFELQSFKQA